MFLNETDRYQHQRKIETVYPLLGGAGVG